jgi:hypothetical protein
MSDEEVKSLVPEIVNTIKMSDISDLSMQKVQRFIDAGLPGIGKVDEQKIAKMTELYLAGKTYDQISNITRIDRVTVMYLSYRLNWCETRKDYMVELNDHIKRRIMEAKLTSQDFLLQLSQAYEKKIGHKITRYMATDNEEFTDQINLKELDRYLKMVELLQKSTAEHKEKGPLVGLNIGDGATITRNGDNELEITPKQRAIGDVLKHYADLRREEDKK